MAVGVLQWSVADQGPQLAALPSITEGIGLQIASQGKDPTSKSHSFWRTRTTFALLRVKKSLSEIIINWGLSVNDRVVLAQEHINSAQEK